jgi:microcystin-dependent protein
MEGGQTRRRFLQAGAGAALGVATANTGTLGQALAAKRGAYDSLYPGELRIFAGNFVPKGFLACKGEKILADDHPALNEANLDPWGGDDQHLQLPDLRSRAAIGAGQPPGGTARKVGDYEPALNTRKSDGGPSRLGLTYIINPGHTDDHPLVAEVRPFAFGVVPKDWLPCDGRERNLSNHTALFSLIGTKFGGDGKSTFAVPDLRSYTPVGHGDPENLAGTTLAQHRENLAPGVQERQPRLHFSFCIVGQGLYPERSR